MPYTDRSQQYSPSRERARLVDVRVSDAAQCRRRRLGHSVQRASEGSDVGRERARGRAPGGRTGWGGGPHSDVAEAKGPSLSSCNLQDFSPKGLAELRTSPTSAA